MMMPWPLIVVHIVEVSVSSVACGFVFGRLPMFDFSRPYAAKPCHNRLSMLERLRAAWLAGGNRMSAVSDREPRSSNMDSRL